MLSALLSQFWPYIAAFFGAIIAYLSVYFKGKSAGEEKEKNKGNKEALDNVKKAKEAEADADKVDNIDDALRDNNWLQ